MSKPTPEQLEAMQENLKAMAEEITQIMKKHGIENGAVIIKDDVFSAVMPFSNSMQNLTDTLSFIKYQVPIRADALMDAVCEEQEENLRKFH